MLAVVGVGIARGHLTERGRKLLESAEVVYGSKKALNLVKDFVKCETVVMTDFSREVYLTIEEEAKNRNVVVLSTGDPMVSGLGKKLNADIVEPGISSVAVALSRLRLDLCEVIVVNCHARDCIEEIVKAVQFRPVIALVTKGFSLKLKDASITVLENLCRENERIYEVGSEFSVRESDTILLIQPVNRNLNKRDSKEIVIE